MTASPDPIPPGSTLQGRYRLEAELGQGGMGVVYRAHDTLLDRSVAVKMLSGRWLGPEGSARLLREAQAAARLNHPNIVSVYDAGVAGDAPFIVMELVEGESLHAQRPTDLDQIVQIARQVCAALDHAHAHNVIHRDLKPENVLIVQSPSSNSPSLPSAVKLMDFGLARSPASRLSAEGTLTGTVFYLAPEQALGREIDGRADLYALGVMLYELVTGRLPFIADDPLAVISQHLHAPVVPPRSLRAGLPPVLEALILRLLAKPPAERPASARDVAEALAAISAGPEAAAPNGLESTDPAALLQGLARGRLVGRRAEVARLRELWNRAREGQGHLVLISGEPGVGKSRLAGEALVRAQLDGAAVLRGGCYEYEATTPYLPFVEALRDWVRAQDSAVLQATLGASAPVLARLAPEIETRLGPLSPITPLAPADERLRLFDHFNRFLQTLAQSRGLLFFIDDLHWADQGTLSLLHYLLRSLRQERWLALSAYRELELDRTHPLASALVEWNRERLATRLPLDRLSLEDTGALLATLFGQASVSSEFASAMFRETEGNPFFIEEVVKSLIEQGQIYWDAERSDWGRKEIDELAIPQSIIEAIGRRLSRLSPECVEALHVAAALGKLFDFRELSAVVGTQQSEERLLDSLDEAVSAQLVQAGAGETFAFTHDKIREVLYEELNPIRRRRQHGRIAAALESLYASELDSHVEDLAYHFIGGGDLSKGLDYSLKAGKQAEKVFAHDDALTFYGNAVEAAEALGTPEELAAAYEAKAGVLAYHAPLERAIDYYERALAASQSAARRAKLKSKIGTVYAIAGQERGLNYLREALTELDPETQTNELASAMATMGRIHHFRAEHSQAIEFLERARRLAEPLDVPRTLTNIYTFLAGAYQHLTRYADSNAWANQSIALGQRRNYPPAVAAGYEFLAENAMTLGDWRNALGYADHDRRIALEIGVEISVAWADFSRAHGFYGLGELQTAAEVARASLEVAGRFGERRLEAIAATVLSMALTDLGETEAARSAARIAGERGQNLGQIYLVCEACIGQAYCLYRHGEWEPAVQLLEDCERRAAATENRVSPLRVGSFLAEALTGLGRLDEAGRMAAEAVRRGQAAGALHYEARARRVQGQVFVLRGQLDEADAAFDEAVRGLDNLESRLELARAIYHRGTLRQSQSDSAGARADLTRAQELFQACGAAPEAANTRNVLQSML